MDIRTKTTKSNLKKALLQCMKEQAFSEVKVKDIILASGISSRTFYQYYKDTHALLLAVEDDILAEFNQALIADRNAVSGIDHVLSEAELITVAENISKNTITFFLKNKDKLEILTSDNGDIRLFNKMVEYANREFAVRMEKMNPNYKAILAQEQAIPPEMVLGIFDINIISVVLQLIKYNDELSPAEMRRYIAGYLTRTPLQFLGLMK